MRQLHTSARLHSGVPYHYAASATAVGLVFTAGACPLDEDGRVVAPGDVAAQTRQALANLQIALEDAGCQPANVLKTTVFVASSSRDDLIAAWAEYTAVYGTDGPPSTLLGVTLLGWPDQLVEIEAVAFRD